MGAARTLNVAASMPSDVYDQPAERARLKTTRRPRVSATPPDNQITPSSAARNGPTSAELRAQTKVPKTSQPPTCSTLKSVAFERVRPEARLMRLLVSIYVVSARERHGRRSAMSRKTECNARPRL